MKKSKKVVAKVKAKKQAVTSKSKAVKKTAAITNRSKTTPKDVQEAPEVWLDEVAGNNLSGFEHIELEDDESEQHPQTRDNHKAHGCSLDEVETKDYTEYPDIE